MTTEVKGEEISLYYGHLDEFFVTEGEEVAAGQIIGTVGISGTKSVPAQHLHFEVAAGEDWYDPAIYLRGEDGYAECVEPGTDYSARPRGDQDPAPPELLYPVACTD